MRKRKKEKSFRSLSRRRGVEMEKERRVISGMSNSNDRLGIELGEKIS